MRLRPNAHLESTHLWYPIIEKRNEYVIPVYSCAGAWVQQEGTHNTASVELVRMTRVCVGILAHVHAPADSVLSPGMWPHPIMCLCPLDPYRYCLHVCRVSASHTARHGHGGRWHTCRTAAVRHVARTPARPAAGPACGQPAQHRRLWAAGAAPHGEVLRYMTYTYMYG